jgi:hypothetical protein
VRPNLPAKAPAPASTEALFARFEALLEGTDIRQRADVRPVVFELSGEQPWAFQPHPSAKLFQRAREMPKSALRVRCSSELLARLLGGGAFLLTEDDDASFEGNIDDLLPLATALEGGAL